MRTTPIGATAASSHATRARRAHGHRSARARIIARPRGTVRRAQRRRAAVSSRISARDRLPSGWVSSYLFRPARPRTSTDSLRPRRLSSVTGHQGEGWPGRRRLQGLHRGWLRPQDVFDSPIAPTPIGRAKEEPGAGEADGVVSPKGVAPGRARRAPRARACHPSASPSASRSKASRRVRIAQWAARASVPSVRAGAVR